MQAALAALVAGLLLPATAHAVPMQADPFAADYTRCFDRTTVETVPLNNPVLHDAVDGNFRGRRLNFVLDGGNAGCTYDGESVIQISGLSVIVKTPYQIDTDPDIDDIDSPADAIALATALAALWPDFSHWVASGVNDPTETPPDGNFIGIELCINAGSIATCIPSPDFVMSDIGGGFMIFTINLGEDSIFIQAQEIESFELTTLVHSDFFNAPGAGQNVTVPEIVMGFRFVELTTVPEPGLALLLLPALAAIARRRSRG